MNSKANDYNEITFFEEENLNIREIIEPYLYYWKWILTSVLLALALSYGYLRYATKEYFTSAQILLHDNGSQSPELAALSDIATTFSGEGGSALVTDQIKILKSRRLVSKVVEDNSLNIRYFLKGRVNESEIWKDKLPFSILFEDSSVLYKDKFNGNFEIEFLDGKKFKVKDDSGVFPSGEYYFGQKINSSFGKFVVHNKKVLQNSQYKIYYQPIPVVTQSVISKLDIAPETGDKKSRIINLNITDNVKERGERIINSLIEVYNIDNKTDNNKLARATSDFINNRLEVISGDLRRIDQNMAQYKSKNNINSVETEADVYLNDALSVDKQVVEYRAQLQIVKHLNDVLNNRNFVLLPSNIGIQDPALNTTINQFNELILEKQEYSKSMKEGHPVMETLDKSIAELRHNIRNSLNLYQNTVQTSLNTVQNKKNDAMAKLNRFPMQEKGFKSIAREQQIVEAVYLHLLQKREESELRASATSDAFKIVDSAYTQKGVVKPKVSMVLVGAFVIGLVLPILFLFFKFLLNNKVESKSDILRVFKGAFLGDIPCNAEKKKLIGLNDRGEVAEAFRIIRSNLNFVYPKDDTKAQVMMVTSTIAGEGKTFTSVNIAQVLGVSGKKVLLVGGDIRSPKILITLGLEKTMSTRKGLTDYIVERQLDWKNLVIHKENSLTFDILHSGTIPPNPSEILLDKRVEQLIEEAKEDYDYIIIDSAPVAQVTDSLQLAHLVDTTLYIVRNNYLDKRLLDILKEVSENHKLRNIAVIHNDVNYTKRGYGYGYGHATDQKKKRWWQFYLQN
ncbi:GumC family protein [Bergeyella zoohelcum]|uniref:non-specific protein-tyrosine kinase n=1 Tax=Bergeyella zoohelcum ATCC 43767 TaxID=883096 RepID=K1LLC8_9FLAO|nr:polysaccharide biosynthesis tyrosine autokinase [Bergeyella zoohelcum]EKB55426.1 capsular exopolysaccharide family protein [Bergeyella zoohelcum ATCC 43767]SUV50181.1 Tyrosine-protein kinase wzc [Bergeyella zoohelcum]